MSVIIIAEAGVNHNGDISIAKDLVDAAKDAGADIVKFQCFNSKKISTKQAPMAEYQKKNIGIDESQEEMLRKLMLREEDYFELAGYCKKKDIQFLTTPFDIDSIRFLNGLQNLWKIPSGEITNYPYLVEIAKTNKPVILSTGMSTLYEVDQALSVLRDNGSGKVSVLHCTTSYPTPMVDVNLRAMQALRTHCKCEVGYSDHTKGIEIPIAAVALGATIIEKHLTLDRTMIGPDHKASLEPYEFVKMIESIRNIEVAMGTEEKKPSASEIENINVARKSIVASRVIRTGELLTDENLTTKRPGNGINPMRWTEVIGTKAIRDFNVDDFIEIGS